MQPGLAPVGLRAASRAPSSPQWRPLICELLCPLAAVSPFAAPRPSLAGISLPGAACSSGRSPRASPSRPSGRPRYSPQPQSFRWSGRCHLRPSLARCHAAAPHRCAADERACVQRCQPRCGRLGAAHLAGPGPGDQRDDPLAPCLVSAGAELSRCASPRRRPRQPLRPDPDGCRPA